MDWKWTITAVLPVMSLILGAWLNQLSETRREGLALKREQRLRELDREQARIDRRETFELAHLAEASACLSRLFRAALLCHMHNVNSTVFESRSGEYDQERQEMGRLQGLVLDDDLRTRVTQAHEKLSQMRHSQVDTAQLLGDSQELVGLAQEAMAERLRGIYASAAA
ncbi:hypothetical protein ACH419_39315 [Streptomyces bobili]|uniref:hypothetical protein n=1 Tax=Streptomyces bobili TaxID=67280 RepID=UPI0037B5EB20